METLPTDMMLTARTGLPEDLRILLDQFPRSEWEQHENLGDMARFWLQRHDMFRELGGILVGGVADYQEGRSEAKEFAAWFAPRLNFFLNQLFGHHHIEDHHYFPVFKNAENRLKRGFEILDSDHHVLHEALEENAETARSFLIALQRDEVEARSQADSYAAHANRLVGLMMRHLEDEEDLIIPVILDQGERKLGLL